VRILDCHSRTMSFGSFFLNIAMKPMASLSHGSARAPRSGESSAPQLANVTSAHEVFDVFLVIVFCKLCIRESFSVTECAVVYVYLRDFL
jgi:hypothetical protein